jgi:hypothetical protein
MRLLEMLTDRFGVFEALAHSTIKLNRCTSADEFSMDPLVAEAVLEFGNVASRRTARMTPDTGEEPRNRTAAGQSWPRLSWSIPVCRTPLGASSAAA